MQGENKENDDIDYLSEACINQFGLVKYKEVKKLKEKFYQGQDYLYNRLWILICLHKSLSKLFS